MTNTTTVSTPARWIAAAFGLGWLPWAPGTMGSIGAVVLFWGLQSDFTSGIFHPQSWGFTALLFLLIVVGTWASERVSHSGDKDPSWVVIDEVAGLWLALWYAPTIAWSYLLGAFALFRLFDIAKPALVGWADRRLNGGIGIMADDLIAGAMANIAMQVGWYLWQS